MKISEGSGDNIPDSRLPGGVSESEGSQSHAEGGVAREAGRVGCRKLGLLFGAAALGKCFKQEKHGLFNCQTPSFPSFISHTPTHMYMYTYIYIYIHSTCHHIVDVVHVMVD